TNAMKVYEAIASVYTDEGVIVLMDLGSALMSAEIALEFLTEEQQDKVHLCEAPLVEGVLAAAVAAAAGNNIEQVMAEARGALLAKASQLGIDSHTIQQATPTVSEGQTTQEIRLIVRNALGLHARPASQFVSTAARFQSLIKVQNVTRGTEFVRADSINQVATLAIRQGHEIAITATGSDADRALSTLQALVESHFGEDSSSVQWSETVETAASAPSSGHVLRGIPASPGVAIAPIVHYHAPTVAVQEYHVENPEEELQRLQNALEAAQQEIQTLLSQASTQIGDAEAAIFDAHMLFLEDPVLIEAVYNRILEQHLNAEAAWQGAMDELAHRYSTVDDSYLQQRVVDVVDVGQRVLRLLSQPQITINENIHQSHHLNFAQPSILVASDLTPSDTAKLNPAEVLGICMTSGSPNSHSAILARSLGIPQVVGLPPELLQLTDHTLVAFDGETGEVWIEPESHTLAAIEAKRSAWESAKQQALLFAHQPAITRDRRQIKVYANLGGIGETRIALSQGAEGVGLLRTEFLYLERSTAPSEEEQLAVYQAIAQVLENRPLIIRTLDIGGDKP
ncbi:HPr family phosphocarrier protein, partial [Aetokthonos hydrillicola]